MQCFVFVFYFLFSKVWGLVRLGPWGLGPGWLSHGYRPDSAPASWAGSQSQPLGPSPANAYQDPPNPKSLACSTWRRWLGVRLSCKALAYSLEPSDLTVFIKDTAPVLPWQVRIAALAISTGSACARPSAFMLLCLAWSVVSEARSTATEDCN